MKHAVRYRRNVDRSICIGWWLIILGLATFWTLMAVLVFGDEYPLDQDTRDWLDRQGKYRQGEVRIQMDDDRTSGKITIYNDRRTDFEEYRIIDLGQGQYKVEEYR